MIISMIAAMGSNRVIGKDNDIPWHLPDDFKYFKEKTRHHHVIMGRKNWESLPPRFQPLPDRPNLVVTRQTDYQANGGEVFTSLESALQKASEEKEDEAYIIGGGEIYSLGLAIADKIYLTEIDGEFQGQTIFPEFEGGQWKEISREHHPIDDRHKYSFDFVVYIKNK